MGIHRVFIPLVLIAPHLVQQAKAGEHLARMASEEIQQVKLARRQIDRLPIQLHFAGYGVYGQAVKAQRAGVHTQVAAHRLLAAEQRFDPRHQFQHRKGFGQVIVGTQLQPQHAVYLAGARADDDDRRVARHVARPAADLQPVDARQHQIEDQRVPAALFQHRHAQIAVGGVANVVAFIAQVQLQQLGDVAVILND
ncbi:hypothetical protein D3C79_584620 [compost metagenome]